MARLSVAPKPPKEDGGVVLARSLIDPTRKLSAALEREYYWKNRADGSIIRLRLCSVKSQMRY